MEAGRPEFCIIYACVASVSSRRDVLAHLDAVCCVERVTSSEELH